MGGFEGDVFCGELCFFTGDVVGGWCVLCVCDGWAGDVLVDVLELGVLFIDLGEGGRDSDRCGYGLRI